MGADAVRKKLGDSLEPWNGLVFHFSYGYANSLAVNNLHLNADYIEQVSTFNYKVKRNGMFKFGGRSVGWGGNGSPILIKVNGATVLDMTYPTGVLSVNKELTSEDAISIHITYNTYGHLRYGYVSIALVDND